MPPIVTLTTDFGLADHYVGTMKGVISGIAPQAKIVDISHDIAEFSVLSGAYTISQSAGYFPRKTVHLIVVDPGVGTSRKAIVVEAGGQVFVAPDNGVLSLVLAQRPKWKAFEITNTRYTRDHPSSTFHGRDIFAPVAAYLATGRASPSRVGPRIQHPVLLPNIAPRPLTPTLWQGTVFSVDRFGNVITNFPPALVSGRNFQIRVDPHPPITMKFRAFAEASPGQIFCYLGSSGFLEVGINQANAGARLQMHSGDSIDLDLLPSA